NRRKLMATTTAQHLFITGLKNAHAMENQALSIMKPQASRIENYPEVEAQLNRHIAETEGQIARLDSVLDTLGSDKSGLKDMAMSLAGSFAAVGHTVAPDEIVKNSFANYAFENYEIAAYKSLITLARESGNLDAIPALEQNLAEEVAMAEWLDANIETVTLKFSSLKEAGETAKK